VTTITITVVPLKCDRCGLTEDVTVHGMSKLSGMDRREWERSGKSIGEGSDGSLWRCEQSSWPRGWDRLSLGRPRREDESGGDIIRYERTYCPRCLAAFATMVGAFDTGLVR